jgi:hypothetical protein
MDGCSGCGEEKADSRRRDGMIGVRRRKRGCCWSVRNKAQIGTGEIRCTAKAGMHCLTCTPRPDRQPDRSVAPGLLDSPTPRLRVRKFRKRGTGCGCLALVPYEVGPRTIWTSAALCMQVCVGIGNAPLTFGIGCLTKPARGSNRNCVLRLLTVGHLVHVTRRPYE